MKYLGVVDGEYSYIASVEDDDPQANAAYAYNTYSEAKRQVLTQLDAMVVGIRECQRELRKERKSTTLPASQLPA